MTPEDAQVIERVGKSLAAVDGEIILLSGEKRREGFDFSNGEG